jgi:hypothetical protein
MLSRMGLSRAGPGMVNGLLTWLDYLTSSSSAVRPSFAIVSHQFMERSDVEGFRHFCTSRFFERRWLCDRRQGEE